MRNNSSMQAFVIGLLENNLPETYHYHNPAHTLYVQEKVLEIGKQEGSDPRELELLSTAALWHDTGYIKTYKGHEEASCALARLYLPDFGYSIAETDLICNLIMATRIPQLPKNKLEEIIADADLEYLGTESFGNKSKDLFHELHSIHPFLTKEKWNEMQISFLQKHHFFTRYCIENKEPEKQIHLKKLIMSTQ